MIKYKNYISLGYFCSVALELERMGLRSKSYPFDWCISSWHGIESALINEFDDFLNIENIYQDKKNHDIYQNIKYEIYFYHDFNKYDSLRNQLENVKEKYSRRIKRFYRDITEPTLFVRYINTEHGTDELEYLEDNYEKVVSLLKNYNEENDILFILNEGYKTSLNNTYYVSKDDNDLVARKPFDKNKELLNYFSNVEFDAKEKNMKNYLSKIKIRDNLYEKCKHKVYRLYDKIIKTEYIHDKQY